MVEPGHDSRHRGPGTEDVDGGFRDVSDEFGRHSSLKRTREEGRHGDDRRVRRRHGDEESRRRSRSPRHGRTRHHDNERQERNRTRDDRHPDRPHRDDRDPKPNSNPHERERSTSPSTRRRHHHRHRRHRRSSTHSIYAPPESLPLGARPLSRSSDFDAFKPLYARYLEVQKQKDYATLDEREIRGRWKSFVRKWNKGELAEGWYDAEMFEEARRTLGEVVRESDREREMGVSTPPTVLDGRNRRDIPEGNQGHEQEQEQTDLERDVDDDDDYGPTPLQQESADPKAQSRHGPGIPTLQDLSLRREDLEEDRQSRIDSLRLSRKADRAEQKARLEELAPRAEPGTRERQLEKKREVNAKMAGFRERSPGGEVVGDGELMGGGDGLEELKRMREANQRKKTEREVRREEVLRAKMAEREERVREYRVREESTLEVLRGIAKARFG